MELLAANTLMVQPKDLFSGATGAKEKLNLIKSLFLAAKRVKAKAGGLVVIWIEDIDVICKSNSELMFTLLNEIDTMN
eukprot:CAMPEP_0170488928 /NCGR_PEP_ID=MMETSP0208-20121228/7365_1 /TAXON_ID=197538 /ORGANISM="Strombidium inclinatum, Strain S3" /LENGTH=77 /DNA_ID=CAMNT_0010763641 /DNA_START=311 /DNA_END=544 /DNA_ORIENTATION=-